MNYNYLMQFIAHGLHTIVRRYSLQNDPIDSFCARPGFEDQPAREIIYRYAAENILLSELPMLVSINQQIVYAVIPIAEYYLIAGPVHFDARIYFCRQLNAKAFPDEWLNTVNKCDFHEFTKYVLLAYNLFLENPIEKYDLYTFNCLNPSAKEEAKKFYSQLLFQNRETGKRHNPYDQEMREMLSIETGDIKALENSIHEDFVGDFGTVARDPVRNQKNLGIAVITLACRAAIRGGLIPECAYSLSDSFILKIEETNDMPTLANLIRNAEFQYAQMVKDLRDTKSETVDRDVNLHIEKCKDYIFTHLHDKITVQEIADKLQIQPNYLSALFKKCEGISLTEFIQNEKINLAKNLLIYSEYSYIEIAAYLGYSSQSHLGKHFKQTTGFTLRDYRKSYGVKNFHPTDMS